jgi:hypothetical protein
VTGLVRFSAGCGQTPVRGRGQEKRDRSITTSVVSTVDGGASWRAILTWVDRIG